ncbi:thioredoxin family protein [Sphingobacterium griseoflavum]|nr:thioredoxin family protein [Sphingobacterium griseoflavum]
MKKLIVGMLTWGFVVVSSIANAQIVTDNSKEELGKPYRPEADAQADIDSLLQIAKIDGKTLIIQAGGNWCIWCLRFNNYIHRDAEVRALLESDFLYYHLNYSKENTNEAVFERYAPKGSALGYPFFIILNDQGEVLAVRDSGSLEAGQSYDRSKVLAFFNSYRR